MNPTDCERVRIRLMASIDGEAGAASAVEHEHVSTCASCRSWLERLGSLTAQLQGLSYPAPQADVWTAVKDRIREPDPSRLPAHWLWPMGALVLGWRALQLFVDLPMPALHPFVPLAAAVTVMWLVGGNFLAIATSAPELQKRGI